MGKQNVWKQRLIVYFFIAIIQKIKYNLLGNKRGGTL